MFGLDEKIDGVTSIYLDDILTDKSSSSAAGVKVNLHCHGFSCEQAERVYDSSCVLGIRVHGEKRDLFRNSDDTICGMPENVTRRTVFSICGQLKSHLPVGGLPREAASSMKKRANDFFVERRGYRPQGTCHAGRDVEAVGG